MEVPLTDDQEKLLEDVAARSQKTKTLVASEAIEAYLSHERWFREQIEESRAAASRGKLIEHDDVVQRMEQRFRRP